MLCQVIVAPQPDPQRDGCLFAGEVAGVEYRRPACRVALDITATAGEDHRHAAPHEPFDHGMVRARYMGGPGAFQEYRPAVKEAAMGTAEKGEECVEPPTSGPRVMAGTEEVTYEGAPDDGALDDYALDIAAVCCLVAAHLAQVWGAVAP